MKAEFNSNPLHASLVVPLQGIFDISQIPYLVKLIQYLHDEPVNIVTGKDMIVDYITGCDYSKVSYLVSLIHHGTYTPEEAYSLALDNYTESPFTEKCGLPTLTDYMSECGLVKNI